HDHIRPLRLGPIVTRGPPPRFEQLFTVLAIHRELQRRAAARESQVLHQREEPLDLMPLPWPRQIALALARREPGLGSMEARGLPRTEAAHERVHDAPAA